MSSPSPRPHDAPLYMQPKRTLAYKLLNSYKALSARFLLESITGAISMGMKKSGRGAEQETPIVIVTLANDGFAMMLAAMLKSLSENHRGSVPVHVYVMDQQVTAENKEKVIRSVADDVRVTLEWVPLDDAFWSRHNLTARYGHLPTTYYRFFLPLFVDAQFSKVVWLDADVIICRDIADLWNSPFDGAWVQAAQDTRIPLLGNSIRNWEALGLNPHDKYFNAGVVHIDMEVWRRENLSELIMQCIEDNAEDLWFHDQYGMNVVLYGRVKWLNPNWNLFPEFWPARPYILHYVSVKPTSTEYQNTNGHYFFQYLDKTAWKGWRPITRAVEAAA